MKKTILMLLIDIVVIAVYTSGFYIIKYKIPKQLETDVIEIEQNANSDTLNDAWQNEEGIFSQGVIQTASLYKSEDISIEITECNKTLNGKQVTYYVADIYLSNIESFKTGFANDTYGIGYTDTVLNMDKQFNSLLTINGDYYGYNETGLVIRNGKLYRETISDEDVCILYYDGTMKTFSAEEINLKQEIENGAYQAWNFGPSLLNNGKKITNFEQSSRHLKSSNPRTAIGYYEKGHYCFVTVDGRNSESSGVTLAELSQIFEELGCIQAYNIDGGKSSVMTFNDEIVNEPADGGRKVSDCIYIQEVSE